MPPADADRDMETDFLPQAASGSASSLLVLVPGLNIRRSDFIAHGVVDALRRSGAGFDILLVEPDVTTYLDGAVASLLRGLIAEKRAGGCARVWMAGISLGCFGALLTAAAAEPHLIQGIILLSPFLGTPGLISEVERAGGLRLWDPGIVAANDGERRVLSWLQRHTLGPQRDPVLHLGYGAADRFASAAALLAACLPRSRTHVIDGGHDWPTWERLWSHILATRPFGA